MNIYELKNKIIGQGEETHFFDADTMKFFGERFSGMRLLKGTVKVTDVCGEAHECYCISVTRRKNAFGSCLPYTYHHYFDINTYHHVIR